MADGNAAQELQKREARLGMQPIAAGDVWQSRMAKMNGGSPAMNASARQSLVVPEQGQKRTRSNGNRRGSVGSDENVAQLKSEVCAGGKPRVFVAAENRLFGEALSRMLLKGGNMEVAGVYRAGPLRTEDLLEEEADILLMTSRGSVNEDLSAI